MEETLTLTRTDLKYMTNDVQNIGSPFGGFGTLFYFVPRLVRTEFVVRTGAHYGRTFNTDLDKFEIRIEIS